MSLVKATERLHFLVAQKLQRTQPKNCRSVFFAIFTGLSSACDKITIVREQTTGSMKRTLLLGMCYSHEARDVAGQESRDCV